MKKKFVNATLIIVAALMVMFLVFGCGNDMEKPTSTGDSGVPQLAPANLVGEYALDRFLVGFKAGADIQAINAASGAVTLDIIPEIDVHILKVPEGSTVDQMVRRFNRIPGVEFAEPDYIAHATFTPNDPYLGNQWGLDKIQAPDAWDITQGDKTVRIAILDTGIDEDHEDVSSKVRRWHKKNFTSSPTIDDLYGHGTHCAGIAAAITNNDIGVAGNGFDCYLMNGKVLGDNGSGQYSWVASGIVWAALWKAKVISMSLSGPSPSSTLERAMNFAWNFRDVVIVAAAGNDGSSTPVYPAYYENCIAVGATDQNDRRASFSNYGPDWVDVAAPGVSIFSTMPNHPNVIGPQDYGYLNGTSMATPFVAGLAGMLWTTPYGTDNASVRDRIESTCDPVDVGVYWAHGRINDYEAVKP